MHRVVSGALLLSIAVAVCAQSPSAHPRDKEIHDPDTLAWWYTTEALSNDGMEGRDTGSAAYERAAEMVAERFKAAGLQPEGEQGYFQTLWMHQTDALPEGTSFTVARPSGDLALAFLREITVAPNNSIPSSFEGALTFRGYCGKDSMADVAGKIVVCFGTQRKGLPNNAIRYVLADHGGAVGIVNVDDPYFDIEPPRWPAAYARNVFTLSEKPLIMAAPPEGSAKPERAPLKMLTPTMRISAEAFAKLLAGSGQDAAAILKAGGARQPLPSFEIPGTMRVKLNLMGKDIHSANVLAALPGSDPKLKDEYVVVSAHLDGYGFGTPVNGDSLYNGTLDDAAYVALLLQMADDIKAGKLHAPRRSILFAAFTGEEKGLLGSNWYVKHPTVRLEQTVADVNLDQLRPLFPLNILTAEALSDSTLGDTARAVGKPMGIEIRPDAEPERGLLRRADQYPFLASGVPAISFIFGYDPGTDAERRYREWYQVRYHRPQDDLGQPMDFAAATKFNTFFYTLVEAIANGAERPEFLPESSFATKAK